MKLAANNNFAICTTGYRALLCMEFAAPVLRGRPIVVAVDGECRRVQIVPPMFQGWAVGRLISPSTAVVVREVDAVERQMLLGQWPTAALHVCHVSDFGVLAVPTVAEPASMVVRLHLCDDAVARSDLVLARFDGLQYWFDRIIARDDGAACAGSMSAAALPDLRTATFATNLKVNDRFVH
jgi:hypothetical protein